MQGVTTILNVVGSVALLLWGVRMVRTGLTRAFGATLRRAIGACSRNRFTAFAGGLGLTGLLQSSTATALLLASFAGRGLAGPPLALALVIGANIGGAWAPYMDQSPTNPAARRVPLANLITRVTIGIAFLPFLKPLVYWLSMVDPVPARLAVNFHSLFSLVAALVFLPLIDPLAALCRRLLVDRPAA